MAWIDHNEAWQAQQEWAARKIALRPSQHAVLKATAYMADPLAGNVCRDSAVNRGDYANLGERQVRRIWKQLAGMGLLHERRRFGTTTEWKLIMESSAFESRVEQPRRGAGGTSKVIEKPGQDVRGLSNSADTLTAPHPGHNVRTTADKLTGDTGHNVRTTADKMSAKGSLGSIGSQGRATATATLPSEKQRLHGNGFELPGTGREELTIPMKEIDPDTGLPTRRALSITEGDIVHLEGLYPDLAADPATGVRFFLKKAAHYCDGLGKRGPRALFTRRLLVEWLHTQWLAEEDRKRAKTRLKREGQQRLTLPDAEAGQRNGTEG